ncbi:MAG: DUF2802 domain-containing protein [Azoarcus sp.]|jgi:hypothetical protein|nr:DUF2802 domain-containing protein [Azoarcus sp.]
MTRQLLWSLIALLMVYGGWQFFRALRAAPRRRAASLSGGGAGGAPDDLDDDLFDYAPVPAAGLSAANAADGAAIRADDEADGDADDDAPPAAAPEKNAAGLFALELDVQHLRREIQGLREAFDDQQEDIDALRAQVENLLARAAPAMAAEPGASPEYDEALALARRGAMSDEIAARCGITRAEADLVTSLAAHDPRREPTGGTP